MIGILLSSSKEMECGRKGLFAFSSIVGPNGTLRMRDFCETYLFDDINNYVIRNIYYKMNEFSYLLMH